MANIENVVTYLRNKNANSFDPPFFIGSTACRVGSVRGINLNNIEENMLLGFDSITIEEEIAEGTIHVIQEFRDEERETEYYYLDTYVYNNTSPNRRWFFREGLYLPDDESDNVYIPEEEELDGVDTDVYSYQGRKRDSFNMVNLEEPTAPVIAKSTLHYVNAEGDDIPVAEKTIYAKITQDGKKVQKQVIKNLLLED